eukprot:4796236-Amphidinium_carterae.1
MSEISQKIKSVLRFVIKVTIKRNRRKVTQSKSGESARKFLMVAEQVMFKASAKPASTQSDSMLRTSYLR